MTTLIVASSVASAATPRKWYWTEAHAETAILATRLPYCRVYPDDSGKCLATGQRRPGAPLGVRIPLVASECKGAGELGQTFRYSRFSCRVLAYDRQTRLDLAVYVTGPTTFRWAVL